MLEGMTIVGLADDLAIVVTAKTEMKIMDKANVAMDRVRLWMTGYGLQLVDDKTHVIVMAGRRKLRPIEVRVGQDMVVPEDRVKYLGIWLDKRRSFTVHVNEALQRRKEPFSPSVGLCSMCLHQEPLRGDYMLVMSTPLYYTARQYGLGP